jgi:hypothetical protein
MYIVGQTAKVLPLKITYLTNIGKYMLDTISLLLDKYSIKDRHYIGLDVGEGSEENKNKSLFVDESGPVFGKKAYVNSKVSTGGSWHFDIKYHGPAAHALVHFSLPKIHHGENFYAVGREASKSALYMVKQDMAQYGIETNLFEARVCRVDMNYDIELDYPFINYVHLLQALTKSPLALDSDVGFYVFKTGSLRRRNVIYDKIKEMGQHTDDLSEYPEFVMRIESRLQKAQTVKKALGIETIGQLLEIDGYNTAKTYMLDTIHNKIFNYTPGPMKQLMVDSLIGQAIQFEGKRNSWGNFIKTMGIKALIEEGGIDMAKTVAKSISNTDRSYRTRKSDIEKISTDFEIQTKDLESLYRELKGKISPTLVA